MKRNLRYIFSFYMSPFSIFFGSHNSLNYYKKRHINNLKKARNLPYLLTLTRDAQTYQI